MKVRRHGLRHPRERPNSMDVNAQILKIAILSDVSIGYGTPQVLRIAESFARVFNAQVHIFEPDQSERPPINLSEHVSVPNVQLTRLYSSGHPFALEGRIEFMEQASVKLRAIRPQILLMSGLHRLPILDRLQTDERLDIFYCLEEIDLHYNHLFGLVQRCPILIFPEENRRSIYLERLGGPQTGQDSLVIMNANHPRGFVAPDRRCDRLFYGGSFHRDITLSHYFLDERIMQMPIDIYGIIDGFDDSTATAQRLNGQNGGVDYRGYLQANATFFNLLSSYLFSIVIWSPDREDRLYACPNKFFDAVACGVPPICAPHPQCVEIIRKWNCGILMDDWSFDSFRHTLERALGAAGSDYYKELAFNCRKAMANELSWDRQFEKLIPLVKKHLSNGGLVV